MALRGVSEDMDVTTVRVVMDEDRGEVTSIDLRDDVPVVEYERESKPLDDNRWSVLTVLVVLNALDIITTVAVLAAGGSENNPLMRPLMEGVWPAVMLKAAVLAAIAWLLGRCTDSRRIEVLMACTMGWYLAVVSWNLTVLTFG